MITGKPLFLGVWNIMNDTKTNLELNCQMKKEVETKEGRQISLLRKTPKRAAP